METKAKDIVKIQSRRVNAILLGLSILVVALASLAFLPINYTKVPEVQEVQEVQEVETNPIYMEIVKL